MKTKNITMMAAMTAVLAICSWISIPTPVPFTMQTFGVFSTLLLLGGKRGTISVALFLCLGAVGLPVFSGFQGGIGHLFGPTGGYIVGFVIMGLLYMLCESRASGKGKIGLLVAGLLVCYLFGTVWFMLVSDSGKSFMSVVALCVLPYLLPDAAKLLLACSLCAKIKKTPLFRNEYS